LEKGGRRTNDGLYHLPGIWFRRSSMSWVKSWFFTLTSSYFSCSAFDFACRLVFWEPRTAQTARNR
jgi:hypothetical protein